MPGYEDDVFALPISGHYDIGYSYGSSAQQSQQQTPPQSIPVRTRNPRYGSVDTLSHRHARSRSPPTVLPLSFTTPRQASLPTLPLIPESGSVLSSYRQDSFVNSPVQADLGTTPTPHDLPPPVPPKSWARSNPSSPRRLNVHPHGSESDVSTTSMRSRQESNQSVDTTQSSASSCSIEPDQLPSHSHPQWLSATQSAAFAGPRPVQPMRLCRREVLDTYSGEAIFRLSDETKLKLSRQAIYQIFEPGSSAIIGTLGYATDASDEVAAILRGQDVVLKRETPNSSRWCFTPSNATKKNAAWYWMKDKLRGDVVLSDAKKGGSIIARIQRDVLSYERAGLSLDTVNEICFSAMALAELARRSSLYEDCPTLAAAIAVVALGDALVDKHSDEDTFVPPKPKRKLTLLR